MDNRKAEEKMYRALRKRIPDEFGSGATINKFYAQNNVKGREQYLTFIAFVETGGRIIAANGSNENEIIEALRYNLENDYSVSARRVEFEWV